MPTIRILLYEDNESLRQSLAWLFETADDLMLCGKFEHCRNVTAQVGELQPDVVIMDIDLPGIDGIEGVRRCKEARPQTNIVMYTVFADEDRLFAAFRAGADGYILKKTDPQRLIDAVRDAYAGGAPITPLIAKKILQSFPIAKPEAPSTAYKLSVREKEILTWLVKGLSYKQIAGECFISVETVRRHLQNIYAKLHVNSGTEAVAKALRDKIVEG